MPRTILTPQDTESLENIAKRIEEIPPSIRAVVSSMEIEGLKVLEAPNHKSLMSGLRHIEEFAHELKQQLIKWRHENGKYEASSESQHS